MRSFRWIAAAAAAVVGPIVGAASVAVAEHERVVVDDHGGRPGGSGKLLRIPADDPRIQPPGKCGKPFLGGTAFGHPDPRLTDPKAVCGHGIVILLTHEGQEGRRPLLILPVTTPVAPNGDAVAAVPVALDPARLIREHLPRLDAISGDSSPVVLELRNAIRRIDVAKAMKNVPRPIAQPETD